MLRQNTTHIQEEERQALLKRANYELFIYALTIYLVLNSILVFILKDVEARNVILLTSLGFSVFLLIDAVSRLLRSTDRKEFMIDNHGYLVFLGSLPVPFISIFRLIFYRVVLKRLSHADYRRARYVILRERARSTLLVVLLSAITVLEFSSIAILYVESPSAQGNIQNASDALWWSLVTIATIGYGDRYPVTNAGRFVGFIVIIGGVGLFSVLTSYLAQWFLRPRGQAEQEDTPDTPPAAGTDPIAEIQALLDRYEKNNQEMILDLRQRISHLESQPTQKDLPPPD